MRAVRGWRAKRREARAHEAARRHADARGGLRAWRAAAAARRERLRHSAALVAASAICWTGTGLRIDAEARVLRTDERPIPGLFAAGELVGSLHGDRYIGGGGSFGPCIVFGKLAGENAASYTLTQAWAEDR